MQRFLNTTTRSVVWFKKAHEAGELIVKPPFQRNPVWSERQQSALIDSILLEYPIPEIYMQEVTGADGVQKHILVDGQQRIRAILDFLAGVLELSDESPNWAGMKFEDISSEDKKKFYEYSFVVRLLPNIPDAEVGIIFQRLNRSTSALTGQELRHATYWGPFIKLMEEVSDYDFWSNSGLFSANDRRRMLDVEFISELAVAYLNGIQNKKKNLEEYYQQYEVRFEEAENVRSVFVKVLGEIEQVVPNISKTRWRKKSDFYTLFIALARHSTALPLDAGLRDKTNELLLSFATHVDMIIKEQVPEGMTFPAHVTDYVKHVERAASDFAAREARDTAIKTLLAPVFPAQAPAARAA